MFGEAKSYCKGILKGVYSFDKESFSEFSEAATEVADIYLPIIFDKWKKICKNKSDVRDVKEYIKKTLNFEISKF